MTDLLFKLGRPFSSPYGAAMRVRQHLYDSGIIKRHRLPCPVISVGNLSMGGTGKTPHVAAIADHLLGMGMHPAVVTRGYGGRAGKGPLKVSDGAKIYVPPEMAGDEPFMMAELLENVPVVAGSDRYAGGIYAVEKLGADLVILDDGFQHISLERDLDLVLMSVTSPIWKQCIFPGGELREPASAIKERASALVVTRCELAGQDEINNLLQKASAVSGEVPVFSSQNEMKGFTDISGRAISENFMQSVPVMVVTALGEPESLMKGIRNAGVDIREHLFFRDHHRFSRDDLLSIFKMAEESRCGHVVVTHKDAVKIRAVLDKDASMRPDMEIVCFHIKASPHKAFWKFLDRWLQKEENKGIREKVKRYRA